MQRNKSEAEVELRRKLIGNLAWYSRELHGEATKRGIAEAKARKAKTTK